MANPRYQTPYYQGPSNQPNDKVNVEETQVEVRTPRADLYESDEQYFLRLSIPGVKKEDLHVTFNQRNRLEISGIVKAPLPENMKGKVTEEIFQGPFKRMVKFPVQVNKKTLQFGYNNGILEIYLDKVQQGKT